MANFSASDSFIGYIYQCEYALYRMLDRDKPVAQISIETLDDIVEGDLSDPEAVLQLKHHDGKEVPLTDKSTDLWKTVRVWAVQIKQGDIDPSRTEFLLLTTSKPSESSKLAGYLAPKGGEATRDPKSALQTLQEIADDALVPGALDPKNDRYKGAEALWD